MNWDMYNVDCNNNNATLLVPYSNHQSNNLQ